MDSLEQDTPLRVGGELDADDMRRLLAVLGSRVAAQFRNAASVANALGVVVAADPADPVRQDIAAADGISRRDDGIAIRIGDLPAARLRRGWIAVASSDQPKRIALRSIVGGPYFPGVHAIRTTAFGGFPVTEYEVTPYTGGNPSADSTVAAWSGDTLAATRGNAYYLAQRIETAIYWTRVYADWVLQAVRSGASRSQG